MEDQKQQELKKQIQEHDEIISLLKLSFQHMLNVLRHVGEKHVALKTAYPNEDLNLSLLKFSTFVTKAYPPEPYEEDGQMIDYKINST